VNYYDIIEGCDVPLAKMFDFGRDPDCDTDPGIFLAELLMLQDRGSRNNFASSYVNNDYTASEFTSCLCRFCCLEFSS